MKPSASKLRLYEASQSSDFHKAPDTTGTADYVVNRAGTRLRDYARWLDENNDITIGVLDVLVNNIVGTGIGIEPQAATRRGQSVATFNARVRELWAEWKRRPEITGGLCFEELQRLACRTWLRDGEVFAEHIQGPVRANRTRRVPYCVRALEPDWLPFEKNSDAPRIVHGVQTDPDGMPTQYHFLESLGDPLYSRYSTLLKTREVPAERVLHLKFARRLNQTRGVSVLHGVINRLDDIKDAEDSERIAMRVAASFTAAIIRNPDMLGGDSSGFLNEEGDISDRYKNRYFEMGPGEIFDNLLPGEDVKGIGLDRPNTNLIEFLADQHRRLAAGTGTSASSISKRYDGTYSAQRQEMVETAPSYARMRHQFVEDFVRPIYERFVFWAIEAGALSVPRNVKQETVAKADFRGPAMPWIDPKKEMEADAIAVDSGFKSRHQVIRERGGDPDIVDQQLQADLFVKASQQAAPAPTMPEDENDED